MWHSAVIILAVLFGHFICSAQDAETLAAIEGRDRPVIVSVLEFSQQERKLYPLFSKRKAGDWVTPQASDLQKEMIWKVIFGGRDFGEFIGRKEKDFYRLGRTVNDSELPIYPNRGKRFYNWNGEHDQRPLIFSSHSYSLDPQNWRSVPMSSPAERQAIKKRLGPALEKARQALLQEGFKIPLCKNGKIQDSPVESHHVHINYIYEANDSSLLMGALIKSKLKCPDSLLEAIWSEHWLHLPGSKSSSASRSVQYLGHEIVPIGGGDFDADGQVEWVFKYSGRGQDGYWLFWKNFQRTMKNTWKSQR